MRRISMKLFEALLSICLMLEQPSEINSLEIKQTNFSNLPGAVNEVCSYVFAVETPTVNIISVVHSLELNDFKDRLFLRSSRSTKVVFRQQTVGHIKFLAAGQKRRNNVFLISNFNEFLSVYEKIATAHFRFNGFYVVVLINGKISETEKIYKLFWSLQIYNVITMYESSNDAVIVETFEPFNDARCDDVSAVVINEFRNGKFVNGVESLFPSKFKNMMKCPMRVACSNESRPYVFIDYQNESLRISGRDIDLITTLSERLSFKINYTFLGREGFFYENGTSEGPLRVLLDGKADLAISDLWLKPNRLKYFDATAPYISSQVIFVIPPGRDFTNFEKLIFPFAGSLWSLIWTCFFIGLVVIFLIKLSPESIQNFLFGVGVKTPYFNMFVGFIGGVQIVLPKTNFARFALMMFLMYSLVIRTLYQASFYHRMHSTENHKEVQTIDEMIENDFTFYLYDYSSDLFVGFEKITARSKIITLENQTRMIEQLYSPNFKGAIADQFSLMVYANQNKSVKSTILKEPFITLPSVIYARKGFYLTDTLNEEIENLKASGLIKFWHWKYLYKSFMKAEVSKQPKVIKVQHLAGCFQVWIWGLFISSLIFTLEVASSKSSWKRFVLRSK